ncbi:MAG: phenylalanine--tRNA ligase subunit alpha [Rhodobacteraceae bacterium]|nr:phenylalanine--tRNA ligase subunit alpha [Paracoccaceae bacterium]
MDSLQDLRARHLDSIAGAETESDLEAARLAAFGRKSGEIGQRLSQLGGMDPGERKRIAPQLNRIKDEILAAIGERKSELAESALDARIAGERQDVTLPGRHRRCGSVHPVSQVIEEVTAIFADLGFEVAEGPQIEEDWYNFDALNIPPEHPARQEHDTFFVRHSAAGDGQPNVLRTHTSPVQIRAMREKGAPIRVIAPGRVYRCDYDQTHTPMFHQIEGLAIDRDISMAHLKWTLEEFCRAFFEVEKAELRFRASHFPFTEPSAEVDLRCSWEDGRLKVGEGDDWMEILGSGMVHPNVLKAGGVDPDQWQGFAFGIGIDRLAMLKYGVPDLRSFFESDIRWLRHYGFHPLDIPALHSGLSR